MEEPNEKNLGRKKPLFHNIDSSQPAAPSKRTRVIENQANRYPSISILTRNILLPPPAPIAKPSAAPSIAPQNINGRAQLEDSDSETEISKLFARTYV